MPQLTLFFPRLPWPVDWATIFDRDAPLVIEIGFGNGLFLTHLAQQMPDANILGLEIALPSLRRGKRRVVKLGLSNVRLLRATGQLVLWVLCRPMSVSAVHINFPDPWPKPSHHQRRLINDRFLQLAATRLMPGGQLNIATDHVDYGQWITDCLIESPYFDSRLDTPFATLDEERARTKYERKALSEGSSCYYFKWQRNSRIAENVFTISEELPMPHAFVNVSLSLRQIEDQFTLNQFKKGLISIRFIDIYRSARYETLVVDTYIDEEPLEQRVLLAILQRQDGDFLVRLHEVGHPRATTGIHLAIAELANWLCELHPDAKLVRHNLQTLADE